jgi:cyclopropane-fatty-acyl-phospholipid synthase
LLGISGVAFAKYFLRHAVRKNSVTQARKNISEHYDLVSELCLHFYFPSIHIVKIIQNHGLKDLFNVKHFLQSNDFFALYLDPSMTYSSGIFKVCNLVIQSLLCKLHTFFVEQENYVAWS